MNKSKVFFTNLRTTPEFNLLYKLEKLVKKAGIADIDFKDKFTAIKIHFGEPGNLAYIRPNYVGRLVSVIKELGGVPFLTDCNTLYSGRRSNAVDHLKSAEENGFNSVTCGCNVIIADGLRGTDYEEIEINLKHCKTAKIGSAIADSDIIISMNHFKGHEMTGIGGAMKNLGMGCGSRGGKLEMHSASKPEIKAESCISCGMCIRNCSQGAISFNENKKASIDYKKCIGCGQCVALCKSGAAMVNWNESAGNSSEKIVEYSYAVIKDKPNFHINFVMDVSPNCDCWANNDKPIVSDIGILASFDPLALDKACTDMVNSAIANLGSVLDDTDYKEGEDKFSHIYPTLNYHESFDYAQKIGLGNLDYEIINV